MATPEGPRVLFLVTEDWYFCSHRLPVARALRDAGFRVGVACRVANHGDTIRGEGFELIEIPMSRRSINPFHALATIFRIIRAYKDFRPDVVHQVALKPAILGSIAARFAGVPRVINAIAGLGFVFTSDRPKAKILRPILHLAFRALLDRDNGLVIVQNPDDGARLSESGAVDPKRIILIPGSGVDLDRFHPAPEPTGTVRVTLVARMIREKGIDDMIEAARILKDRNIDISVTLAGDPDPENPSSIPPEQLEKWRSKGIIEYLGHVDDVAKLWAESHIAVLPSYYGEGIPLSLIEAAAAGLPMIAVDGPGLREVVIHDKTGLLIPARNANALADAITTLARDGDLRKRMGDAARQHAAKTFGREAIAVKTLGVYRTLMGDQYPEQR
ncbi:MAG: glycosyltransferase family 4 protein [Alphaproteobacteria bacterium]|jgi:glycosyltransferase involved in cell wall biosynthesis